jgi:hypothetical protein
MKKLLFSAWLICFPLLAQAQSNDAGSSDSQGATKFVAQFWSAWSSPNSAAMPYIQSAIDDQINFYGKPISRDAYMKVQQAFAKRWPDRQYTVQPGSEEINCDQGASRCDVKGIVDWKDFSPERGSLSTGSANFSFLLRKQTVDSAVLYLLAGESGSVISRNLSQATSDSAIGGIASSQPVAPPTPPPTRQTPQDDSGLTSSAIGQSVIDVENNYSGLACSGESTVCSFGTNETPQALCPAAASCGNLSLFSEDMNVVGYVANFSEPDWASLLRADTLTLGAPQKKTVVIMNMRNDYWTWVRPGGSELTFIATSGTNFYGAPLDTHSIGIFPPNSDSSH